MLLIPLNVRITTMKSVLRCILTVPVLPASTSPREILQQRVERQIGFCLGRGQAVFVDEQPGAAVITVPGSDEFYPRLGQQCGGKFWGTRIQFIAVEEQIIAVGAGAPGYGAPTACERWNFSVEGARPKEASGSWLWRRAITATSA